MLACQFGFNRMLVNFKSLNDLKFDELKNKILSYFEFNMMLIFKKLLRIFCALSFLSFAILPHFLIPLPSGGFVCVFWIELLLFFIS